MSNATLQPIPSSRLRPLRDEAYERLRVAILDGTHAPGDWLREEELSKRLGISRMPVREALRRLENEGMLKHFPNRGSQVTAICGEDMADVYDARMFVESRMAKLAARRITPSQLERMARNLETFANAEMGELVHLASEFDEILMEASGNSALRHIGKAVIDMAERVHYHTHSNPQRRDDTLREHRLIYDALSRGDEFLAEAATMAHISAVKTRTLKEFAARDSGRNSEPDASQDNGGESRRA
ncbi:GntR family transcriptional regulator [Desulfovibrio sp. OttesenSCG-928-I05]|nr:GntR family transcriptional regulator [Desulfovibrio sp. OttesenSCG-928-I05]